MKLAAFILCILNTVSYGVLIIPLAWCIPMTIWVYQAYKGERELSVGFKVCVLLFVSMIAGILLLCDDEVNKTQKQTVNKNADFYYEDEEDF